MIRKGPDKYVLEGINELVNKPRIKHGIRLISNHLLCLRKEGRMSQQRESCADEQSEGKCQNIGAHFARIKLLEKTVLNQS